MKKAIREWAFNLFTKRITIKVLKLPDNARIEFLANRLMDELIEQGHDIKGGGDNEFLFVHCFNKEFTIDSGREVSLRFKRKK